MILYVNGDSHSAGAEAVNPHCFAEDDRLYYALGRQPHPDNLKVSFGCNIANELGAILECDAESASSNTRIFRTTEAYLKDNTPDFVIIGWTTWEREEWLHEGTYYQVTGSGTDSVPPELRDRYRAWVIETRHPENINRKIADAHEKIANLHLDLLDRNIPHVFFNTFTTFGNIHNLKYLGVEEIDWQGSFVDPYVHNGSYYEWLVARGYVPVNAASYHFGPDAHRAWSAHLYQNYIEKLLTK